MNHIETQDMDGVKEIARLLADGTLTTPKATEFLNKHYPIGHQDRTIMASVLSVAVSVAEMARNERLTISEIHFLSKVEFRFSEHVHCPICMTIANVCGNIVRDASQNREWVES